MSLLDGLFGVNVNKDKHPGTVQSRQLQTDFYNQGLQGLQTPPSYFPGSTVAGFTPAQQQGLQGIQNVAGQGAPGTAAATGLNNYTLGGGFLSAGNPYFQQMADAASRPIVENYQRAVQPGIDAGFASGGRMGSGSHFNLRNSAQETLGRQLADTSSQLAFQNYGQERGYQNQAIGAAPGLDQAAYAPAQNLLQAGALQQQQSQAEIDAAKQRYDFGQDANYNNLARYAQVFNPAGYTANVMNNQAAAGQATSGSPLAQMGGLLATGLGGYGLYKGLSQPPQQ